MLLIISIMVLSKGIDFSDSSKAGLLAQHITAKQT